MLTVLRNNFFLKVISLLTSIMMWLYVTADRYPSASVTRTVNAELVKVGQASPDLIVRFRTDTIPVEISGPKTDVEAITDNAIKAEIDVGTAHLGMGQLRVSRYRLPANRTSIEPKGRSAVIVDILQRLRKTLQIQPVISSSTTQSKRFGMPRLNPEFAVVSGTQDDMRRVSRLAVVVDTAGAAVSADLTIHAEDKDGLDITGVEISPGTVHVEMPLEVAPSTRTLVVNPVIRVKTATGFQLSEVDVEPRMVTVLGSAGQLQGLTNVSTQDLVLEELNADTTRQVALVLPEGVTLLTDRNLVRVTIKVKEINR